MVSRNGLHSMKSAAGEIGISRQTLHKYFTRQEVPEECMVRLPSGRVLFREMEALRAWYYGDSELARRERLAAAEAAAERARKARLADGGGA